MMPKVTIQYDLDNYDEFDKGIEEERKLMRALQAEKLQDALDEFTGKLRRITKNGFMADGIPYNIYVNNLPLFLSDSKFEPIEGVPLEEYGKLLAKDVDGDTMTECIRDLYFETMKDNNINLWG